MKIQAPFRPAALLAAILTVLSTNSVLADTGKSIGLGAGVVAKPKYEGSDKHEAYAIPLFIPKFTDSADENPTLFKKIRRRIKFRGLDDIRLRVLDTGRFEAGAVTGYIGDRDQSDGRLLRGTGDIDGGLVLGGYAGVHVGDVMFDAAVFDKVSGDDAGVQFRFGAETERQLSEQIKITARAGTTFASEDYMQTYFGVTAAQSASSVAGLPVYSPDSGFKDIHFELGGEVQLGQRWILKAGGRYGYLLGDAADSPLVETEHQFSGTVGLAYLFNLDGRDNQSYKPN